MKIELSQGKYAMVDRKDYGKINQSRWCFSGESNGYAKRRIGEKNGRQEFIYMHHEIIGKPSQGMEVDHKNRNKLDNRRGNLRFLTISENRHNREKYLNNTSGTTGVSFDKFRNKWVSRIQKDGKGMFIGRFDSKKDAIKARREAMKI